MFLQVFCSAFPLNNIALSCNICDMKIPKSDAGNRQYPVSAPEVAKQEGCAIRTVQNWAGKNDVRTIGGGNRAQYLFFEEDIEHFREREKPGRRCHKKN
jgi:hypothetical protein